MQKGVATLFSFLTLALLTELTLEYLFLGSMPSASNPFFLLSLAAMTLLFREGGRRILAPLFLAASVAIFATGASAWLSGLTFMPALLFAYTAIGGLEKREAARILLASSVGVIQLLAEAGLLAPLGAPLATAMRAGLVHFLRSLGVAARAEGTVVLVGDRIMIVDWSCSGIVGFLLTLQLVTAVSGPRDGILFSIFWLPLNLGRLLLVAILGVLDYSVASTVHSVAGPVIVFSLLISAALRGRAGRSGAGTGLAGSRWSGR